MTQQAGHITKAYDVELERLHSELIDMVQAVRRQASDLTGALSGLNAPAAEAVVAHDASIIARARSMRSLRHSSRAVSPRRET